MNSASSPDWLLFAPVLILTGLSLSILFSISSVLGWTQLVYFFLGLILFMFFSRFDYQHHRYLVKYYFFLSLFLLLLPFVFGVVTRGSVRWIQLGSLTLQPSEIVKPLLIIIFSYLLSQKPNLISYFFSLFLPALLIFKQPDLGSSLVVLSFWIGIWLASGFALWFFFFSGLVFSALSPLVYRFLKPYQRLRIISFLNPYSDPKGSGYQVIQSLIAVGSGRFWGRGLGHGSQSQLRFLPERHTDFIFAVLAEELGFVGSLVLLLALFFLLKRLLVIARQAPDQFGRLISIGVFSMFFFQSSVNIAMNLGWLPVTGITLPLVSAGGSSMIASLAALGIVNNISSRSFKHRSLEIK